MDKESVNWCRLAKTIMQHGGEVIRQLLLLEILTQSFSIYSRFWMEKVHNPAETYYLSTLLFTLSGILKKSLTPHDSVLNKLLKSWSTSYTKPIAVMDQIDRLKKWKNDIEKERRSASSSVNTTFKSWSEIIEQEIQELNSICTLTMQWNSAFHCHLKNAQTDLLLEIEQNDGFLSRCCQKLKLLSTPSRDEFQQLLHIFREELKSWKCKCSEVFRRFCNECRSLISLGLQETKRVPKGYGMDKFLYRFQKEIDDSNLEFQVDLFYDKWDDDLHKIFDSYDKQAQQSDSTETILNLAQSMCTDLEHLSSFKGKKIKNFFGSFSPPKLPEHVKIQCSKLQHISRTSDLNECDLTILLIAWIHGKLVHSPLQDWDDDPHNWDISISADVGRLRSYRNATVAHIAQLRISSEIFEQLWKELASLLRKIASRCGDQFSMKFSSEIDQMKECSFEPHREYELQRGFLTWCKTDILAQLSQKSTAAPQYLDMLQSIQTALENLARRRQACTCRICHNDFFTENELAEHMRLHQDCRCLSCNKTFSTENELTNHMRCHQELSCHVCEMPCSTEWEFRRHMWCNQECRCLSCDETFLSESMFEEHITSHKALRCRICNNGYSTESELCQHMLGHQARSCLSCGKNFSKEYELEQHIKSHQARTCRSCNKHLSTAIELEEHMKNHQARSCRSCNMEFSIAIELEEHMRYHEARTCRSCSKEFSTAIDLEEHMRYHKDDLQPVFIPLATGSSIAGETATGAVAGANQSPASQPYKDCLN